MILHRFGVDGEGLGIMATVGAMVHTDELRGEDAIEFLCEGCPGKGERLVWVDADDDYMLREHIVVSTVETLGSLTRVRAESSLFELRGDYVLESVLTSVSAESACEAVLRPTRWKWRAPDIPIAGSVHLYHTSALAALRAIEDRWDCDAYADIDFEPDSYRVRSRTVCLVPQRGEWRGLRLAYGKNIHSCRRTVHADEVVTALYGWGKGLGATDDDGHWTGGYHRKLSFANVNDGIPWVGDEEARQVWGLPTPEGGRLHRFGEVTFHDCEDPIKLKMMTIGELAKRSHPRVSYEVDAAMLGSRCPRLGDTVAVVDETIHDGMRAKARVTRRVREIGETTRCQVTVGTGPGSVWRELGEMRDQLNRMADDVSALAGSV